ncbi:MAG: shikimate dehydrogenase [Candidatus Wenzhouxiangella sp. M2_3B_020]
MLKLAVFGHPVSGSKSPAIHARFAEAAGLDVDYHAIDCPSGQLAAALAEFRAGGGSGCNLTVPLKAEGLDLADVTTDAARDAGACNTLVLRDERWHADNTDGAGLLADFERLGIPVRGRRVLIVGAGGAVAGILGPLLEEAPRQVTLANRTIERAAALIGRFEDRGVDVAASGLDALEDDARFDLLIQGTSLGHDGNAPEIPAAALAEDAVAYDLNYGRAHEPFAAWCAEHDTRCHDGRGMLIEQAARAFERFTGTRPDTAPLHDLDSL